MSAALAIRTPTPQPEWFASWFDSAHYRHLYAHRDEAEAARFIDTLIAHLRPGPGAAMLDLGCGTGRHARRLAANGFDVTGLDLSADSIRIASRHQRNGLVFARHDMRVPFGDGAFDYVFNLFTSFGYFATADEHLAVVRNISRSLRREHRPHERELLVGERRPRLEVATEDLECGLDIVRHERSLSKLISQE